LSSLKNPPGPRAELPLGKHTLSFIEAPMLHWPDSMFTYIKEEALLIPNDAFGQHLASSFRFDDQVENKIIMEEAARYYANILYPLSRLVLKKLEEVNALNIPISMIAPSHGVIWRENPGQIIESYRRWASGEWLPKAVVVSCQNPHQCLCARHLLFSLYWAWHA
jgi:flavorubredoxin